MAVFFKYYSCVILLSERAKVFIEVLHFYNSETKRLLLMVLAVRPIGPWFLKVVWTRLKKSRACVLCGQNQTFTIGFLFQGINTGPWVYLIFHSIRIQFEATLLTLKMENKSWTIPYLIYCTTKDQSVCLICMNEYGSSMNMDRQTLNRNHREFCWSVHLLIYDSN